MKTAEDWANEIMKLTLDNDGNMTVGFAELRAYISSALTAFAEERVCEAHLRYFEGEDCVVAELEREAASKARAEALEEAAKILEGDILESPDEFEGKTKLKVFNLIEKLAEKIRALKTKEK